MPGRANLALKEPVNHCFFIQLSINMDLELARLVAEDLDYLFKEWNQDVDDASLRRSSTILRALLVEGLLTRAAHQAGREIRVMAPAISRIVSDAELRECAFFQAGGPNSKD